MEKMPWDSPIAGGLVCQQIKKKRLRKVGKGRLAKLTDLEKRPSILRAG